MVCHTRQQTRKSQVQQLQAVLQLRGLAWRQSFADLGGDGGLGYGCFRI